MGEFVDYEKFSNALLTINQQQVQSIDGIRVLIIKTADELRQDMKAQHANTRHALEEQNRDYDTRWKSLVEKLDKHEDDDRSVERRVTIVEETQKRIIWIVTLLMPCMISLWEGFKWIFKK